MSLFLFAAFIAVAFAIDARCSLLPNVLTIGGTIAGYMWNGCMEGTGGLLFSLLGMTAGFFIMIVLYGLGALGAGDVKLFAALGAISGTSFVLHTALYSMLFAGLIAVIILCWQKRLFIVGNTVMYCLFSIIGARNMQTLWGIQHQTKTRFPFMYAVVPGVMAAWLHR